MSIYTVNTVTLGVSEYTGLDLNSVAELSGSTVGIGDTELLELTGDDDEGTDIAAYIQTGEISFGNPEYRENCPEAHIYGILGADSLLTTIVNERGVQASRDYTARATTGTEPMTRSVKLDKGVRAVAWAFKVSNVDGADMQIKHLSAVPALIKR